MAQAYPTRLNACKNSYWSKFLHSATAHLPPDENGLSPSSDLVSREQDRAVFYIEVDMEPNYQPRHSLHQGKFINDGFFPDLDLETLQKRYRIDGSLSLEALFGAVLSAVIYTNQDLYQWACKKAREGYSRLSDVPAPEYGFELVPAGTDPQIIPSLHYVGLYEHAVFARVKGELTRENSHHTLGKEGIQRQMSYHDLSNDFYRQAIWAVRQIKGEKRIRAGFI